MSRQATLKTVTLGCKVNQYETEFVAAGLATLGFREAEPAEAADLCIVNTCTVTAEGDSKSRQTIRQLAKQHPDSRIVVMGCYATRAPEEVAALPNVTDVVTDKRELPDLLRRFGVVDLPDGISRFGRRQRAYVKVQDGCLLRCSYCIIPVVRPVMSSRSVESITAEVGRLVTIGEHREIILTGIHLGHYGVDRNRGLPKSEWIRLPQLLRALVALPGEFRIRLSSIDATEVTRELLDVMAEFPGRICPHLHICLQSGSEGVLRRMQRRCQAVRFVDRCRMAQAVLDRPAITTDIIVGFPGETEAEFAETLAVAETVGFAKIHAFPFSPRQGTPAADLPDRVEAEVKKERLAQLSRLETSTRARYFQSLVGARLEVLVEGVLEQEPGRIAGTACRFAPVAFTGEASQIRRLSTVQITRAEDDRLIGVPLAGSPIPR